MTSVIGHHTQSVGRVYDEEHETHTSAAIDGRFGIENLRSSDVCVVKTGQDFLGAEGMDSTYRGYDFLCKCTPVGNVLERKSVGWMSRRRREEIAGYVTV